MTAAAATSRRPSLVHPEAALLDPARHELALADAARRLGRELSAGERRIDLVRLDRDLAAGKERLVAAIESERRSAASRFAREAVAGRSPRMRLHLSPTIRRALRGLYDAGRSAGRGELARAGYDPDRLPRALAAVPARLAVIEERIDGRLAELGVADEHRLAVAFDLSAATRGEIMGAVARLPGVRAIAADFTSVPAFAGLGSVWDEADAAGITSAWTYTAVMDDGTCDTCSGFDGETYESWDAIQEVLPDGGPNPDCDGGDRCRCRAVPEFGDQGSTGGATGDGGGGFPAIGPDEAPPLPDSSAILDSLPGAERVPASEAAPVSPEPHLVADRIVPEFVPEPTANFTEARVSERAYRVKRWARDRLLRSDRNLTDAQIDEMVPAEAEKIRAELDARIRELVGGAEPRIRVSPETLDAILNDARFKSQFETGTSGGALDNFTRAEAEQEMFGYPMTLADEERPIYSYLGGADETRWLDMYGDVQVVLVDSVKRRATFTLDDSLGMRTMPRPIYGDDLDLAYDWMVEPGDVASQNLADLSGAYPEMQVHGGLSVRDIAEVRFPEWREPPYWQRRYEAARKLLDLLDSEIAAGRLTEADAAVGRAVEEKELAEAGSHLVDPFASVIARLRSLGIRVRRVSSLSETEPG